MKDYYKILNVPKTATEKQIKASFRKLAKKFHPDVNKNNPTAEANFKEINEAYNTLGDEEKKSTYDMQLSGDYSSNNGQTTGDKKSSEKEKYTYSPRQNMSERDFKATSAAFESFFGFDPKGTDHNLNKKSETVKPMKTKDAFNSIFGDRRF